MSGTGGYDLAEILAVLFAAAFCLLLAERWLGKRAARRKARKRARRYLRGESDAETLLERHGYRITDRQVSLTYVVECDGEPVDISLRADLLVEREGRALVAEVKTGDAAPELRNAATRRQLLEYLVAYELDGVLLVDVEAGNVMEIGFPLLQ